MSLLGSIHAFSVAPIHIPITRHWLFLDSWWLVSVSVATCTTYRDTNGDNETTEIDSEMVLIDKK